MATGWGSEHSGIFSVQQGELSKATNSVKNAEAREWEQVRALYSSLLFHRERFAEFKELLAAYPKPNSDLDGETPAARLIRDELNERVMRWIGSAFLGLAREDVLAWRAALVEGQLNVSLTRNAPTYAPAPSDLPR